MIQDRAHPGQISAATSLTYNRQPQHELIICHAHQAATWAPEAPASSRLDLRFIPEEQSFAERQPRDSATDAPPGYEPPPFFTTAALQHSNVKLTWDATPDERRRALSKRIKAEELRDDDFKVTPRSFGHQGPARSCSHAASVSALLAQADSINFLCSDVS